MKISQANNSKSGEKNELITSGIIEAAEVIDVVLNSSHAAYTGPASIGNIYVRRLKQDYNRHSNSAIIAHPFFPNQRYHPLRFEIVLLFKGPSTLSTRGEHEIYYYISAYSIWGLANHNGIPFIASNHNRESADAYNNAGTFSNLHEKASEASIELGDTFIDKANVPTPQPYEGDNIYFGRWGNVLRFGSTVKNSTPVNTWSSAGGDGDPIIILSNTLPTSDRMGQVSVEDINDLDASIYMCSTQKIDLESATSDYSAYKSHPEKPNAYAGKQVLINSDRLIFNSKASDILLFANKTIGLSAVESVNISAGKAFVANAEKYYLGVNATEPIILGDTAVSWLKELVAAIKAITVPTGTGPSGVPVNLPQFEQLLAKLNKLLSKTAFTD